MKSPYSPLRVLAPFAVLLFAALVLLPRLSGPGLWEPDEMKVADEAAKRADRTFGALYTDVRAKVKNHSYTAPPPRGDCPKTAADDVGARELTNNLIAFDIDWFGSSEGAMRLGLALLALLCALATYGIAARLAGPRAGAIASLLILSFPLLVMQGRQLTSQIGTATGATLIVYGLVAAARPARGKLAILDLIVGALATIAGVVLAFLGGGALLGVVPPLAAVALAGGLGFAAVAGGARALRAGALRVLPARHRIGRRVGFEPPPGTAIIGLVALIALAAVALVLVHQIYDIQNRAPGTREIFGKSFVPRECWSDVLGGVWKAHDDGRMTYDAMFEQAAFGMFPWSVLAPIALLGLAMGAGGEDRRYAGRLTLAWAAVAWTTGTVFERKVGFNVYAGFPACAIGLGLWLDGFLERCRLDAARGSTGPGDGSGLLLGLWALVGMFVLGKDVAAFPEKLAGVTFDSATLKFPDVHVLFVHPQSWLLVLAWLIGLAFALGAWSMAITAPTAHSWRAALRSLAPWGVYVSLGLTGVLAIFWGQVWQPTVSSSLSSKDLFSVYRDLHQDGERLGIFGDIGNAPRYYAGGPWDPIRSKEELVTYLSTPERAFALAPSNQLCEINRSFAGKPYAILDDSNARFMLLSNQTGGARDRNPLSTMILHQPPEGIGQEFHAVYDNKIELIGFTMPRSTPIRGTFTMTLYFHVLDSVPGTWKIFAHFDGKGLRFQGDHDPIGGRCATSYWQKGDYVVDTFQVEAGDLTFEPGNYEARVGFFTGTNPNWKNMKVSSAPQGAKDDADRVLIGTIAVE